MPRYSLDPAVYPSTLFEILRYDPPQEASIPFDSVREGKNFQFRFWGLRKALEHQVAQGNLGPQGDYAKVLYRAERTEARIDGSMVTFAPKELLTQTAQMRIILGRKVDPSLVASEMDAQVRRGEAALLEMIGLRQESGGASSPGAKSDQSSQDFASKTLQQVLLEESLKEGD